MFAETDKFLNMLFGYGETIYTHNAYQFDDYSKYDIAEGVEPFRAKYTKDLESAYALGKRLV